MTVLTEKCIDGADFNSDYAQMRAELEIGDCVAINEKDEVFFCGRYLGRIGKDFTERFVFFRIRQEMDKHRHWPNIYRVNDHGNVSLLDGRGNEVRAWV